MSLAPGKPRDEHAHPREQRADEDDDDEEDLPADADGGVASEADVVTDHRVIDDALQSADGVLQNRRPRDLPDGGRDRAFDDGAIERAARGAELRPGRCRQGQASDLGTNRSGLHQREQPWRPRLCNHSVTSPASGHGARRRGP